MSKVFQNEALRIVFQWLKANPPKVEDEPYELFVVWFSKTLDNWKALVSTSMPDGLYFEVTHNGAKQETYLDVYSKIENVVVKE